MNQLKLGFKYAIITVLVSLTMGVIYGLSVGILLQPAIFLVLAVGVIVTFNFVIAVLSLLPWIILKIFKKPTNGISRYFLLSSAFFGVFFLFFVLIKFFPLESF